ncbi:protein FAM204A isoform X2 [Stegastes partitus]|uniref:Family with sequence similarity 204 member A n=1 Tax=Stegastes partitus TaxID=144197 RepID=A0A3B4Z015_9TELE|nr:PREDICTED: protein FAM204A isoform X2 [Stegastes partitus]
MYSGLLPKGITEDDLSPDEEAEQQEDVEERREGEKGSAENLSSAAENTSPVLETQSTYNAGDADSDSPTCSMPGISQEAWQKFQDLRRKKDDIKMMKIPGRRKRRRHKKGTESEEPAETRERQEEREKHWDELQQYFGVNDRFHPPACSKPPPKSGLEKSIERAIAEGDIAKAEEMSDRLATREMAVKIAQAADCRDFVQRKQEEEALRAAQKRKKQIAWGFEAKKRWETKSNMGFM